jgi:glycosyltransferase involved in cell wall biosynthesis
MDNKIKILQVISSIAAKNGGPTHGAIQIHESLRSLDNTSCMLIALNRKDEDIPRIGENSKVIQFQGGWIKRHLQFLCLLSSREKDDIVLIHGLHRFSSWGTGYILQLRKIPYFVQLHGTLEEYELARHRFKKKLFMKLIGKRFLEKAKILVVASSSEGVQANKQVPQANIQVITLGASIGADSSDEILSRIKTHFFETPLNKRLLFLGRLAQKKHPEIVIEITKHLPDHHLVLAGPEDYWSFRELSVGVSDLDLDRISYVGLVDESERKSLFDHCGIFLLPSENENFGIAIAEASLGGLYCITSDQVATSEHFAALKNGRICSSLEVDEWVSKIIELEQFDYTIESRANISNQAKKLFSWDRFVNTVIMHASNLKQRL